MTYIYTLYIPIIYLYKLFIPIFGELVYVYKWWNIGKAIYI
jgi:hypothetical protein